MIDLGITFNFDSSFFPKLYVRLFATTASLTNTNAKLLLFDGFLSWKSYFMIIHFPKFTYCYETCYWVHILLRTSVSEFHLPYDAKQDCLSSIREEPVKIKYIFLLEKSVLHDSSYGIRFSILIHVDWHL